ncbi:NAD-dependent epimerase/dehydratase family protein [Comamonas composti]|uniref:NAD-dependent epimerase/dehydratase family protein n=1 Tax=Comamonas composti TaxID=408558 RepID=UPI00041F1044|nr:NAD(P)-dependent oxidoreductase [Comamonas composti]
MTVLVTGATGGLGRNAVEFLQGRGRNVRATGRDGSVGKTLAAGGAEFVALDLARASRSAFESLVDGVQAVWHCAALSSPWGRAQDFLAANVKATQGLAQAAVARGVERFVHVSTPSLYFDYSHRRDIDEDFRPAHYVNHYARTKAEAEQVIRDLALRDGGTRFVMLRPRGIFGPHDRVLFPRVLRLVRERGGRLPMPRAGQACIDLTYVTNVVHAMDLAGRADVASGSVFNITNGEPTSLGHVLGAVLGPLGLDFRLVAVPYPAVDMAARAAETWARMSGREPTLTRYAAGMLNYDMTLNIARARQQLGYEPVVSLADGLAATVEWIREHGKDYGL